MAETHPIAQARAALALNDSVDDDPEYARRILAAALRRFVTPIEDDFGDASIHRAMLADRDAARARGEEWVMPDNASKLKPRCEKTATFPMGTSRCDLEEGHAGPCAVTIPTHWNWWRMEEDSDRD